ncbi:MAG: T9SS type A sorting domain-containing protein, partial [Schleiferiaceae bacterium]|nr:T9SS type A sorting domain-containing protein [Schleiferiaceae bacterium]
LTFLFDFAAGSTNVGDGSVNSTFFFDDVKYAAIPLSSDKNESFEVNASPNPTFDRWTFTADSPIRIEIYSLQGSLITFGQGQKSVVISALELPSGVYVARIKMGESTSVQRVIKL